VQNCSMGVPTGAAIPMINSGDIVVGFLVTI